MAKSKTGLYFKKDKKVKLITKSYSAMDPVLHTRRRIFRYISNRSFWAYTSQLSQVDVYTARTHGTDETRLFVLNYRDDLKLYDYIEYRGTYYMISRLDTTDDYNGELFVYVKDYPKGEMPEDIQPAND